MLFSRWQAPVVPTKEQIYMIFQAEDLNPEDEFLPSGADIENHRHPYDEVRMVVSGEILFNIAGNQMLIRPGDRLEIPSNTRHSLKVEADDGCLCVVAKRAL
jgi:quercetin dioxygenase-like cupin family protein